MIKKLVPLLAAGLSLCLLSLAGIPPTMGFVGKFYLFAAAALMPMIPGGFLTFSSQPLYSTYELAPRLAGINALNDQQVAGVLMKVGNLPLIWTVIAVIWFRWYRDEQRSSRVIHRDPVTGAPLRAPVDRSSV